MGVMESKDDEDCNSPFCNKQGGTMNRMDGIRTQKLYGLPAIKSVEVEKEPTAEKRSWFYRRLVACGVIMEESQPKPPSFYFNGTMIVGLLIIAILVVFAFLYAVKVSSDAAYEKGKNEERQRQLEERLTKTEADAKKAKELQLYTQGAVEEGKKEK